MKIKLQDLQGLSQTITQKIGISALDDYAQINSPLNLIIFKTESQREYLRKEILGSFSECTHIGHISKNTNSNFMIECSLDQFLNINCDHLKETLNNLFLCKKSLTIIAKDNLFDVNSTVDSALKNSRNLYLLSFAARFGQINIESKEFIVIKSRSLSNGKIGITEKSASSFLGEQKYNHLFSSTGIGKTRLMAKIVSEKLLSDQKVFYAGESTPLSFISNVISASFNISQKNIINNMEFLSGETKDRVESFLSIISQNNSFNLFDKNTKLPPNSVVIFDDLSSIPPESIRNMINQKNNVKNLWATSNLSRSGSILPQSLLLKNEFTKNDTLFLHYKENMNNKAIFMNDKGFGVGLFLNNEKLFQDKLGIKISNPPNDCIFNKKN